MRCLLVDDETLVRAFVQQALLTGSTLDYAQTLAEGLQLADTQDYDLILADLRLPGCRNGEALTKLLEVCPDCAILVLTSLHSVGYAESLIRQGAVGVFFKPDAAMEPELATRLLQEAMIFAVARHEAQQQQLLRLSVTAQAVQRLQRDLAELRKLGEVVAVHEARRLADQARVLALEDDLERLEEKLAERSAAREQGRWGFWSKVMAVIGAAVAALGPWLMSRWNRP